MADLDQLLEKTSRTFALSIPVLPEPTRRQVTIAYLLFRIADTFEDASQWPVDRKVEALRTFVALLEEGAGDGRDESATWVDPAPVEHDGYTELLRETPAVLEAFRELDDEPRRILHHHLTKTGDGMAAFVERSRAKGTLRLADLADLRHYTYIVAGIVGEMLTELFVHATPDELRPVEPFLAERARRFGEALQLVNILKDAAFDATEGRGYLPEGLSRKTIFELAREDLTLAAEYTHTLQRVEAPRGMVEFCALPVLLAWSSLERVERDGPGAKLTRPEVFALVAQLQENLEAGRPAIPVPSSQSS